MARVLQAPDRTADGRRPATTSVGAHVRRGRSWWRRSRSHISASEDQNARAIPRISIHNHFHPPRFSPKSPGVKPPILPIIPPAYCVCLIAHIRRAFVRAEGDGSRYGSSRAQPRHAGRPGVFRERPYPFSRWRREIRIIHDNSNRIDAVSVSFLIRKSTTGIISFSAAEIGMNGRALSSTQ